MRVIAIHQPNFVPWYPFFQKISACNKFILLGHCQFAMHNYQNRFSIDGKWHTMSVDRSLKFAKIVDMQYSNPSNDWEAILRKLPQYKAKLSNFTNCISSSVWNTNVGIIQAACGLLGIQTDIGYDSETTLNSTDRLVEICKSNGATHYLSGIGGKEYLEVDKFTEHGIDVMFQDESIIVKKPLVEVL